MICCTPRRMITPWDLQIDTYYDALNPDGQASYPASASAVSALTDLGKRGNNQSQPTGGLQPTYTRNANNNMPAISFNGSQWMSCAAGAGNAYQGEMTILGLWEVTANGGTQRILTKILSWSYSILANNYNWNVWQSATGMNSATATNPIVNGTYQNCTINYNRGTDVTFYKDGASLVTNAFTALNDAGVGDVYLCTRDGTQQYVTGAFQMLLTFFRELDAWELMYMNLWIKVRGDV